MKNYYFQCSKLDKGMVIIFDYRLDECYKTGSDLVLKFKGREMLVPHSQLKTRAKKLTNRRFPSKFNGKNYGIYHFKWEPTDKLEELIVEKQQKLL
jgi:hypothetical protein